MILFKGLDQEALVQFARLHVAVVADPLRPERIDLVELDQEGGILAAHNLVVGVLGEVDDRGDLAVHQALPGAHRVIGDAL